MSISGGEASAAETPSSDNGVVQRSLDFHGRPSIRSKSGCWKSAPFILGVEVTERLIYYGISSNLVNYLTGPLKQSTATAAAAVNAWSGTASLLPLLGGFVADSFLGRYRMIILASLLYILGVGLLSLSATLLSSKHCKNVGNDTNCSVPSVDIIIFYLSLYLVALAQGGHKPCVLAFGADQFDEEHENENKAKSSFFNWWYFAMCASISVGILGLNYIQDNLSWELCFGVSCIAMILALLLFLLGTRIYRFSIRIDEEINPFVRIGRVFITAVKNRTVKSTELEHQGLLVRNGGQFQFLDKALYTRDVHGRTVCNPVDVEETKAILRLVPILLMNLPYAIIFSQTSTFFNKQGGTMDRYITPGFQIPAASLLSFISLTIVVFVPIYDRIIVPMARAVTNIPSGLTMLQRIGIGIFLSFLCMVVAAAVERKRLAAAAEVNFTSTTVPMSVWWLAPQYVLFGIADVFTMVGIQELFYDQVSSELKSIGLAMGLSIIGVGGFLSSFLVFVIGKVSGGQEKEEGWFPDNLNRGHLDYFYWFLSGVSALGFAGFLYVARSYSYRPKLAT